MRRLLWVVLFSLAMGYLEAVVVVYLREIYYPEGFNFPQTPLVQVPSSILLVELGRELATILMIVAVGILAGHSSLFRWAAVMMIFGIWDLTYYGGLYLILGWPPSLRTWDVLFLIPWVWVGPVWAPMGISLALITAGFIIWWGLNRGIIFIIKPIHWFLEVIAGSLLVASFLYGGVKATAGKAIPPYPWGIWVLGMGLGLATFGAVIIKSLSLAKNRA